MADGRVGFVGLGAMGYSMAGHVHQHCTQAHGQPAIVWNRSPAVAQRHAAEFGSQPAATLAELCAACSVVITCLPTSAVVAEVAETLLAATTATKAPKVLVDCTSGDPHATQALAAAAAARGHAVVDAPVSGGPAGAAAGTLAVLVGGAAADVARVAPLLASFAKKVEHLGPVGSGHAVKAVNNALNATHLLAGAEGLLALQRFGVAPDRALAAINMSSGRSLQTEARLPEQVLTRRFAYGFKLGLMHKDLKIAQGLMSATAPLPGASSYFERTERIFATAAAEQGADEDYTKACMVLEKAAGMELRAAAEAEG